jgi:hypothetical protein
MAERLDALFPVATAAVDRLDDLGVVENGGGFQEIDLPTLQVLLALGLVPLEEHAVRYRWRVHISRPFRLRCGRVQRRWAMTVTLRGSAGSMLPAGSHAGHDGSNAS